MNPQTSARRPGQSALAPARSPRARRHRSRRHQYRLLTRRTNRSDITLSARVRKNRSSPTKNRLGYAGPPPRTWSDPVASDVIAAVIVCPPCRGSTENNEPPVPPATIATIIVSPIAREIPRMKAARDPGHGRGHDDAQARRSPVGAETERRFPQRVRHRVHRVLGDRRDQRRHEQADRDTGRHDVEHGNLAAEEALHEVGADEAKREEPHHDARDRRERLEDRLEEPTSARTRVLGQIQRGTETERRRRPRIAITETITVPTKIVLTSKRFRRGNQPRDQSVWRSTLDRKSIAPPASETHDRDADDDAEEGRGEEDRLHAPLPPVPGRRPREVDHVRCRPPSVPRLLPSSGRGYPPLPAPSGLTSSQPSGGSGSLPSPSHVGVSGARRHAIAEAHAVPSRLDPVVRQADVLHLLDRRESLVGEVEVDEGRASAGFSSSLVGFT